MTGRRGNMKANESHAAMRWTRFAPTAYAMSMAGVIAALLFTSFTEVHTSAQSSYTGQWLIESKRSTGLINFNLIYANDRPGRGNSMTGFNVAPDELRGLTQAQMSGGGQV